jgi:two-component system OmpR family sensor kinase
LQARVEASLLKPRPTEEYQGTLRGIQADVTELTILVETLLASARECGAEAMPLRLNVAIEELASEWAAKTGALDRIVVTAQEATIKISREELGIILGNALDNALKFSPQETRIEVAVTAPARLTITDRGEGIPDDAKELVFDRFYRTDSSRTRAAGGMGIGLSVLRRLVEASDGTAWFEDANPGTRLVIEW